MRVSCKNNFIKIHSFIIIIIVISLTTQFSHKFISINLLFYKCNIYKLHFSKISEKFKIHKEKVKNKGLKTGLLVTGLQFAVYRYG